MQRFLALLLFLADFGVARADVTVPSGTKPVYTSQDFNRLSIYKVGGVYFGDGDSNTMKIAAPSNLPSDSIQFIFPATNGSANQCLATDGSGTASWITTLRPGIGQIVNADVSASAAIVYGKLYLTNSIVNTDVNSAAGIAYSKLSLANSIVNTDINSSAAIADTKLGTLSTAGKVANSATTATNANTASTIVARDAMGDFSAGEITANLIGDVNGAVTGPVTGNVTGNLTGNVTGDVTGDVTGNLTGNVTGAVTGPVTGNVTGNLTGNVTGNVTGNLTGNVTGALTGPVTGNVSGNLTGNVTGDVTGNLTGNASGTALNITGVVLPDHGGTGIANNALATLTRSGNHGLTLTTSGTTNVTLPNSGTLATVPSAGAAYSTGSALTSETALDASRGGTGVANNTAATTTRVGNFALTLTLSGITGITLPTSGTVATVPSAGVTYSTGSALTSETALDPSRGGTGVVNNTAATLTRSGNHALTLTTSGTTNVTLPTSGTVATLSNTLNDFSATTSAQFFSNITNETGSGAVVGGSSPVIDSPVVTTFELFSNQAESRYRETTGNGGLHYVGFKAPADLSADKIWALPTADGSANQALITDGSGSLSWATASTNPTTTAGDLLYSSNTATPGTLVRLGIGGATTVLHGGASAPSYSAVAAATDITGQLPLANGGTAKNMTAVNGGVIYTDTDSQEVTAAGTTSQVFIGGTPPSFGNVPAAALPEVTQSAKGAVLSAGQLLGTNTNDTASAGYVGEIQNQASGSSSTTCGSSAVITDVTNAVTPTLNGGSYLIEGQVTFSVTAITVNTFILTQINCTGNASSGVTALEGDAIIPSSATSLLGSDMTLFTSRRITIANGNTATCKLQFKIDYASQTNCQAKSTSFIRAVRSR